MTKKQMEDYIDRLVAERFGEPRTVKAEPKAKTTTKTAKPKAHEVNITPLTVTMKGFVNVAPWMQTERGEDGRMVRDDEGNFKQVEVGRIFEPVKTAWKGEPKGSTIDVSNLYIAKGAVKSFDPRVTVEVQIKPEVIPNKDRSPKHSRGGKVKTRNVVLLDKGLKFYVNGWFPTAK